MSNSLAEIWGKYETARAALKVVHRCVTVGGIDRRRPLGNTLFFGLSDKACVLRVEEAADQLADTTVLSLYAAFEARLRDHIAGHAVLLNSAAGPGAGFGPALADSFRKYCEGYRMDDAVSLYASAVGPLLVSRIGSIRTYRHWLAHGKAWTAPPKISPQFAFRTTSGFLKAAGLF